MLPNGPFGCLIVFNQAGKYLDDRAQYEWAECLLRQALKITHHRLGETHPKYANLLNNQAALCRDVGRAADAERLYLEASEIDRGSTREQHPDFATRLNNLAALYRDQGKLEEAEPFYLRAIETLRETLGERDIQFAASLSNLATLYGDMNRFDEAELLYRRALEVYPTIAASDTLNTPCACLVSSDSFAGQEGWTATRNDCV